MAAQLKEVVPHPDRLAPEHHFPELGELELERIAGRDEGARPVEGRRVGGRQGLAIHLAVGGEW